MNIVWLEVSTAAKKWSIQASETLKGAFFPRQAGKYGWDITWSSDYTYTEIVRTVRSPAIK